MATKNKKFDATTIQLLIYYPFKYKDDNTIYDSNDGIQIERINSDAISYDNFIRLVDSNYNDDSKYSRCFYSFGLKKNNDDNRKYKYFPNLNNEKSKNDNLEKFVNKINDILNEKSKGFKASFNRVNVVLYKESKIGFLELYVNYVLKDQITKKYLVEATNAIGEKAGDLKKIFYNSNNKVSNKDLDEHNKNRHQEIDKDISLFSNLLSNIYFPTKDNKYQKIIVDNDDILFNCLPYKKRGYSYITLFINSDKFNKLKFNIQKNFDADNSNHNDVDFNTIMLNIGRGHSSDSRKFNEYVVEKYLYEDENSIMYCVTNVSFGALVKYTDLENFNYYSQHVEEQCAFLYEMTLHQRLYLYTVVEKYRKEKTDYYKLKQEFDDMITRFDLSLVSEVEPQDVYVLMRKQLHIEEIIEDANKALEAILSKQEKEKENKINKLTLLLSIFGIFGIITGFFEWLKPIKDLTTDKTIYSIFSLIVFFFAYKLLKKNK